MTDEKIIDPEEPEEPEAAEGVAEEEMRDGDVEPDDKDDGEGDE